MVNPFSPLIKPWREDSITVINQAIEDLQKGKIVLIFDEDDREGETDFVMASQHVTPAAIRKMRKEGGGLIFLMIAHDIADTIGLPFLSEVFNQSSKQYPVLHDLIPNDLPYDNHSSFSLPINHRQTFTGVTDIDRSHTMKRFAELTHQLQDQNKENARQHFGEEFRSPGHIPVCIADKHLLNARQGHTELSVALMQMAELIPVASGCEIMADTGRALPKEQVKKYAQQQHLTFLEGNEIIEAWKTWSK